MMLHAVRATPWWTLAVAGVVITLLLRVVEQWPYAMWPLQGIAVGLLAASATWPFDEPSAAIVDSLPRGLAWRTAARASGVLALMLWWLAVVRWTEEAYFDHAAEVAWQGCAAMIAAVAHVTWQRRRGTPSPARAAASALVAVVTFVALARPLEDQFPIFPYTAGGPWPASTVLWSVAAAGGAVVLVAVLGEIRVVWPAAIALRRFSLITGRLPARRAPAAAKREL